MTVTVRFNRGMAPYNAGETAGFPKEHADRLERQGYATKVAPEPAKGGKAPTAAATDASATTK